MKLPGPDHPISVTPAGARVRVRFNGKVIADTATALVLKEASYPARYYIPREDADMTAYERTDHHTHCPYKGDASYFRLSVNGSTAANAVWSYEQPYPAVAEIKDCLAFYPDKVSIELKPD